MKIILTTALFIFSFSAFAAFRFEAKKILPIKEVSEKEEAFLILEKKCNACHRKENKGRIFTRKNMNRYSKKIYRQVFKEIENKKLPITPAPETSVYDTKLDVVEKCILKII